MPILHPFRIFATWKSTHREVCDEWVGRGHLMRMIYNAEGAAAHFSKSVRPFGKLRAGSGAPAIFLYASFWGSETRGTRRLPRIVSFPKTGMVSNGAGEKQVLRCAQDDKVCRD